MNILKKTISICLAIILATSVMGATLISASALSAEARYYESIPDTVYATVGEPFEIFYNNIVSLPDLTIIFTIPQNIKKNYYNDRIVLTPQTSGDYDITWRVYDREYVFVESGKMKLIARTRNLEDMSVLVLGDSTVFAGSVTQNMLDIFDENNAKLTLYGTMGYGENLYEGRSGWRSYDYCNMYENDGVTNPFYNDGFDFSYYMNSQNYSDLDAVIIQLGINDVKRFTFENYSSKKTLEAFDSIISSIEEYDDEIAVIISLPLPSNENVSAYDENFSISSPIECRNNVVRLVDELTERYSDTENVYFSAANCSINAANQLEDAVHPTYDGYKKIAFRHVDTLNFITNKEIKPEPTKIISGSFKNDGVSLKWVPMSNVDYYEVIRLDKGTVLKTTEAFCVDDSVETGNTYKYIIKIYYKDGYVYNSESYSVTIIDSPVLKTATNGTKGVNVSWDLVLGAESYVVYRKTGTSSWKKIGTTTNNSYVDTKVLSGNKYTYTVRASLDSILSGYDKVGVSCYCLTTPALSAIGNKNGCVQVKWSEIAGADGYYVYRKTSSKGKWSKIGKTTDTSYTDKSVKSSNNYCYTVRAYKGSVLSGFVSNGIAIKYLSVPALAKISSSQKGVTVDFDGVSGAREYYIYRKTAGVSWKKIATVSGGKTYYLDKSAVKGTKYAYTVRAVNGKYLSYYDTKGLIITDKY